MCRPSSSFPWPPPRREMFSRAPTWSFWCFPSARCCCSREMYISPAKAGRAAGSAILFAGLLFAVLYEILLGVFGRVTVSELEFPAVSLMSMVTLPGGFLHRQDALMVGVWFFTLFALICSSMYYSCQCMEKLPGQKRPVAWNSREKVDSASLRCSGIRCLLRMLSAPGDLYRPSGAVFLVSDSGLSADSVSAETADFPQGKKAGEGGPGGGDTVPLRWAEFLRMFGR